MILGMQEVHKLLKQKTYKKILRQTLEYYPKECIMAIFQTLKVKGEYYVYYSTPSKIALTIGKTIYSLGAEKQDNFPILFPVTTGRTANNAYTATDPIDKFPTETITYTKIFGQDGFPTTSGILKTDSVWTESENGRQYFYPSGTDNFYVRRAIASGWSSFKLVTAT